MDFGLIRPKSGYEDPGLISIYKALLIGAKMDHLSLWQANEGSNLTDFLSSDAAEPGTR